MKTKILRYACYASNITMAIVSNLPPLLFLTFRELYGISYSLLGLLVLINFSTQLIVDLIFSFFSGRFHIPTLVRTMPILSCLGLLIFAIIPWVFPTAAYIGLLIGTIIFSAGAGLAEVLISPIIATLPSENPERDMSALHSIYAWGVVFAIVLSTAFLFFLDNKFWYILVIAFIAVPLTSSILFMIADVPLMRSEGSGEGAPITHDKRLWLCVFAIFLGGAVECNMAQWASSYLEASLGIDKIFGDIFGVAMFAVMLGFGRSFYAKRGGSIEKILFISAIGATTCYLVAALTNISALGLVACAMTGLFAAMMWPGSLIVVANYFPAGGVFIYALMAAGGDFGASLAPQLTGIVTDAVAKTAFAEELAGELGVSAEAIGMKCGLLLGALFAIAAIVVYYIIYKGKKKRGN